MNIESKAQGSWIQALIAIRDYYYRTTFHQSGSQFKKYWMRTKFDKFKNGKYIVVCDKPRIRDWLANRGQKVVENILVGILGEKVEVEFVTDKDCHAH